jgi:hypothetical protein
MVPLLVDMATSNSIAFMPGNQFFNFTGKPPGFATFNPDHTLFLLSNGTMAEYTNGVTRGGGTNLLFLTDGVNGGPAQALQVGPTAMIVTMPDWSPDGKSVVLVAPQATRGPFYNDDDHLFGGSLYTLPYAGQRTFGAPSPLLMSAGENNLLSELFARRQTRGLRPRSPQPRRRAHRRVHRYRAAAQLSQRQLLEPERAAHGREAYVRRATRRSREC